MRITATLFIKIAESGGRQNLLHSILFWIFSQFFFLHSKLFLLVYRAELKPFALYLINWEKWARVEKVSIESWVSEFNLASWNIFMHLMLLLNAQSDQISTPKSVIDMTVCIFLEKPKARQIIFTHWRQIHFNPFSFNFFNSTPAMRPQMMDIRISSTLLKQLLITSLYAQQMNLLLDWRIVELMFITTISRTWVFYQLSSWTVTETFNNSENALLPLHRTAKFLITEWIFDERVVNS